MFRAIRHRERFEGREYTLYEFATLDYAYSYQGENRPKPDGSKTR